MGGDAGAISFSRRYTSAIITGSRADLKRMAVHDISGRLVTEGAVQPGRGEALWRCASAAAGTYVLTIYDGRGEVMATERVVKE
jgi:hypothetical protein